MIPLASALHDMGHEVTYIAEERMTVDRRNMGWKDSVETNFEIIIIKNKNHISNLINSFSSEAVHCVQGVYANGEMRKVRHLLKKNGVRWGAMMETIDERSWLWPIKRMVYWRYLSKWSNRPDFVLSIGEKTKKWVEDRGFLAKNTFPFTYFIEVNAEKKTYSKLSNGLFRIGYVGQLIPLKRVDLLIDALAEILSPKLELIIIGDGPLYNFLEKKAFEKLNKQKFTMLGQLQIDMIPSAMKNLDCLVLPSDYDGWGVVVTEALMTGVPVICSDACGASEAVISSGVGGVFPKGDIEALRILLKKNLSEGVIGPKKSTQLSIWANSLGNKVGANYFCEIINFVYNDGEKPSPPWKKEMF